jgi:diaminopimelate epimerase
MIENRCSVKFEKYHGLGNDFILIDLRQIDIDPARIANGSKLICDRRFGVGADGVLLIHSHHEFDARLEIYNADGSRPEMCGNGIRCVAAHLLHRVVSPEIQEVEILTDSGVKRCSVEWSSINQVAMVTVNMGIPSFDPISLPCKVNLDGSPYFILNNFKAVPVSMGNPHAVIFCTENPSSMAQTYGPSFEFAPIFPNRCNIEFARRIEDCRFEVGVWERGCGLTLACGTGACAVAAAALKMGFCNAGQEIQIDLPGGSLFIGTSNVQQGLILRGPAVRVFSGDFYLV